MNFMYVLGQIHGLGLEGQVLGLGGCSVESMSVCAGLIEAKLRSLRVEFGLRLREEKQPSGSGRAAKKPWRFMESLMFLRDYVVPRGTTSNLTLSSTSSSLTENDEIQVRLTAIILFNCYFPDSDCFAVIMEVF